MTVKEIAGLWETSEKTVRLYCKNGYIEGAYKNSSNNWVIPDNYPQPYISRKKKFRSQKEKLDYVLFAIESEKNIDFRLLAMNENTFDQCRSTLVRDGFVYQDNGKYLLTVAGADRCGEIRSKKRKDIKDAVAMGLRVANTGMQVISLIAG